MKPVIILENGRYVIRSVECGKRFGNIYGKYEQAVLHAPPLYASKDNLFNKLVAKRNGFIRGEAGHGKSTLMLNIAKHFHSKGYNVLYKFGVNISNDLKDFNDENENTTQKINKYQDVDILFIDDFFREGMTAYKIMDIFNPIIQHRIDNNLPTYINSNYRLDEIYKIIASKVDSISADAFCDRIKFKLGLFGLNEKNYRLEK
jgi:DNA replication protein DnaC